MVLKYAVILFVGLTLDVPAPGDRQAYPMDWASEEKGMIDLSGFLERPAGRHGPVGIKGPARNKFISDTEELAWMLEGGKGLVGINTERTQALIGHVQDIRKSLKHLQVNLHTPFACVMVTSADGRPLVQSRKILLLTLGRAALTDMGWDADHKRLLNWGRMPMQVEAVTGTVRLRHLAPGGNWQVRGLDGNARPLDVSIKLRQTDSALHIKLSDRAIPWYVLERD